MQTNSSNKKNESLLTTTLKPLPMTDTTIALATKTVSKEHTCAGENLDLSSCKIDTQSITAFSILFTSCNVPFITSITPLAITYDTLLTINGI